MKKQILFFFLLVGFGVALVPNAVRAQQASQADCGIWLCLKGNFPTSSCNPYKKRFYHRLIAGKDPLVPLIQCDDEVNISTMTEDQIAAAQAEEESVRAMMPSVKHKKKRVTREQAKDMGAPRNKVRYLDVWVGGRKHPRYWY